MKGRRTGFPSGVPFPYTPVHPRRRDRERKAGINTITISGAGPDAEKESPADAPPQAQQPYAAARRQGQQQQQGRAPLEQLQQAGAHHPMVDLRPKPLAHPHMPAQTAEIGDSELRRRNDVPHDRPRNIPDRLAALQQTLEKVVLLAADQFSVHTSQRGVEAPVTDQPRTPESHISATGHPSCRKRPHVGTEVHRIGDRHLDPPGHPRRASLGILGMMRPPATTAPGCVSKKSA